MVVYRCPDSAGGNAMNECFISIGTSHSFRITLSLTAARYVRSLSFTALFEPHRVANSASQASGQSLASTLLVLCQPFSPDLPPVVSDPRKNRLTLEIVCLQ